MNCMTDSKENYWWDLGSSRVKCKIRRTDDQHTCISHFLGVLACLTIASLYMTKIKFVCVNFLISCSFLLYSIHNARESFNHSPSMHFYFWLLLMASLPPKKSVFTSNLIIIHSHITVFPSPADDNCGSIWILYFCPYTLRNWVGSCFWINIIKREKLTLLLSNHPAGFCL